jgi:hypothetical protein
MLMSEDVRVHHSHLYFTSGPDVPDPREARAGQRNGLCGAAVPGALYLVTGLHTGMVGITIELHEQAPPVDESWEEVVEVSFRPSAPPALVGWGGEDHWPLDLAVTDYRVRYSGTGLDQAHAQDTRTWGEPEVDRYLLQFWPAPPAPDQVIRQTSAQAAYWHGVARDRPPPSARTTTRVDVRRDREGGDAERRPSREEREWGGRLPGERLRRLRGQALTVTRLDRPFVEALAEADPATQREIARWVTRHAYAEAGLTGVDWIDAALAAMDRGEPLPAPFDDGDQHDQRAWDLLFADERVPSTVVTSLDGAIDDCSQQAMAFPALFSAREADPLRAAVDAIHDAAVAFGYGRHPELFAELRRVFPAVDG